MLSSIDAPTVLARDLAKTYYLTQSGEDRGIFLRSHRKAVEALRPISFVSQAGESIGIIGRNGSGKSTLFSLIAGHESPSSGQVLVSSQPTLLSVSAALQPHLSAVENVRLGLLAKGLSPAEADEMKHDVAQWADIGEAIDRPLRTYSSGMGARLKFSIATAVKPDILLVDEALATGDAAFNEKAKHRMQAFLEDAATVFLVTHSVGAIQEQCTRAMWLHQGELLMDGDPAEVSAIYRKWTTAVSERDRIGAEKTLRRARNEFRPVEIVLDSEATHLVNKVRW